jgi:hypothetical protein
VAATGD